MTRTQKTLGLILIVQVVLILLVRSPFGNASTEGTAAKLFPQLAGESISKIQLTDDKNTVTLSHDESGWHLDEFGGFPADAGKVDELIGDLAALGARRPVARSARYHATFKIDTDGNMGRVRLWGDGAEKPVADLIVGNSANYHALRVRRHSDDAVYEVEGLAAHDVRADAGAWIETRLIDVEAETLQRVSIVNPKGTLELVKGDAGWTVEGQADGAVDQAKVEALVRKVSGLAIVAPLGSSAENGPAAGTATATVTIEGPEGTKVILIGDKRPDNTARRSITVEGSGYSAEIWDSSVSSLIDETLNDLS